MPSQTPDQGRLLILVALFVGHILSLEPYLNQQGFLWLNQACRLFPAELLAVVTEWGNGLIAACVWLTVLCFHPRLLWKSLLAIVLTLLVVQGLKSFYDLSRPAALLSDIRVVGEPRFASAMPSGHTATVFLLAGMLWDVCRGRLLKCGLLLMAILAGLSRVAVGAHWPQDVALGALLGWAIALACWVLIPESSLSWRKSLLTMLLLYWLLSLLLLRQETEFTHFVGVFWQQRLMAVLPLLAFVISLWQASRQGDTYWRFVQPKY